MFAVKQRRGRLLSARREVTEQNRIRNGYERNLAQQLISSFNRIGKRSAEQYEYGGINAIDQRLIIKDLSNVIVPNVRAVMTAMIDRFVLLKQKQSPFESYLDEYINTQVGTRIELISATTLALIRKAILDGTGEDLGPIQIARLIQDRVSTIGRRRAITIARTETHSAASFANHNVAKDIGIDLKKRWVSTNDERTRQHHRDVNGQEVGMDEDFIIPTPVKGGAIEDRLLQYAGDPRGGPQNTINCRCVVVYFEEGDEILDS